MNVPHYKLVSAILKSIRIECQSTLIYQGMFFRNISCIRGITPSFLLGIFYRQFILIKLKRFKLHAVPRDIFGENRTNEPVKSALGILEERCATGSLSS